MEEIRQQSALTQEQANELANDIKQSTWQSLKIYQLIEYYR